MSSTTSDPLRLRRDVPAFGLRQLLAGIPGLAARFRQVPPEYVAGGAVSCPCGERPELELDQLVDCACGRYYLLTQGSVWAANARSGRSPDRA